LQQHRLLDGSIPAASVWHCDCTAAAEKSEQNCCTYRLQPGNHQVAARGAIMRCITAFHIRRSAAAVRSARSICPPAALRNCWRAHSGRIRHTIVLDDPLPDPPMLADHIPDASPEPQFADDGRLEDDWVPQEDTRPPEEAEKATRCAGAGGGCGARVACVLFGSEDCPACVPAQLGDLEVA
jgi:hypothetical protein